MSQIQVRITKGHYRGQEVHGTFPVIRGYVNGARGGFITIRNPSPAPGTPPVQRIQVEFANIKMLQADGSDLPAHIIVPGGDDEAKASAAGTDYAAAFMESETDEEAMNRMEETFAMLDKITDACAKGIVRGLVVSGPPGIGKSFGVEKQLAAANLFRTRKGEDPKFEFVTGGVSAIGLYQKLYHNRQKDRVMCLDDSDAVLFEEECLSLLKGALNSGDKRRIAWNKESRILEENNIDKVFDFEGSIIFLSNIDFERQIAKGSRIASHLEAIMSRCHYMDLEISGTRDKLLRIKQVVRDGMLTPYNFTKAEQADVISFVTDNAPYLRELSLRMVKKIADFVKADPKGWYEMAEATTLTKEAKFKRLHEKKLAAQAKKAKK